MTTTLNQPTQLRVNSAFSDFINDAGVRISTPVYIDVPPVTRKQLFNDVRTAASKPVTNSVKSVSGITVEQFGSSQQSVETYLGCSIDVLRTVMFQRGGIAADLLLKLQAVVGYEVVSVKDLDQAFKSKLNVVKEILKNYPFTSNELP
jgi:hypothetical protein